MWRNNDDGGDDDELFICIERSCVFLKGSRAEFWVNPGERLLASEVEAVDPTRFVPWPASAIAVAEARLKLPQRTGPRI